MNGFTTEDARQILSDSRLFTRITAFEDHVSGILDGICRINVHVIQGFPILSGWVATTLGWARMSMPQTCTNPDTGVIANWLTEQTLRLVQQARNRISEIMIETVLDQICYEQSWETLTPSDSLGYLIQPIHHSQTAPVRILPGSDGSILIINQQQHQVISAGERMLPDSDRLASMLYDQMGEDACASCCKSP